MVIQPANCNVKQHRPLTQNDKVFISVTTPLSDDAPNNATQTRSFFNYPDRKRRKEPQIEVKLGVSWSFFMASSSLQASLHKPFLGPKHPHLHRNSQVGPLLRFSSNGLRFSAIRATSSAVSLEPVFPSNHILTIHIYIYIYLHICKVCGSLCNFQNSSVEENRSSEVSEVFACPVCYEPLIRKGPSGLNL